MKVLHWAIILVIILLPVSIVCRVNTNAKFSSLKDEVRINNAIDTATKDAIDQIITISGFNYDDEFGDVIDITPELAQETINTFFHTLAVNYNIPYMNSEASAYFSSDSSDSYIKNYFSTYVPAIMIVAYDGFYVYSLDLTGGGYKYQLSSKIPFTCSSSDGRYSIGYTLGNDIYLYVDGKCYTGTVSGNSYNEIVEKYNELCNNYGLDTTQNQDPETIAALTNDISLLMYAFEQSIGVNHVEFDESIFPKRNVTNFMQDYEKNSGDNSYSVGPFHEKRRKTIIDIITASLTEEINIEQNRFADLVGVTYNFYFPTLSEQDWINTIDDISFLAFVQGIPMGNAESTYYNNFALGGSKIVKKDYIYINEVNGVRLYHNHNCPTIVGADGEVNDDKIEYIVLSKEEAISDEYKAYPCLICN